MAAFHSLHTAWGVWPCARLTSGSTSSSTSGGRHDREAGCSWLSACKHQVKAEHRKSSSGHAGLVHTTYGSKRSIGTQIHASSRACRMAQQLIMQAPRAHLSLCFAYLAPLGSSATGSGEHDDLDPVNWMQHHMDKNGYGAFRSAVQTSGRHAS